MVDGKSYKVQVFTFCWWILKVWSISKPDVPLHRIDYFSLLCSCGNQLQTGALIAQKFVGHFDLQTFETEVTSQDLEIGNESKSRRECQTIFLKCN